LQQVAFCNAKGYLLHDKRRSIKRNLILSYFVNAGYYIYVILIVTHKPEVFT